MEKTNEKVKITMKSKYSLEDRPKKKDEYLGPCFSDYADWKNNKANKTSKKQKDSTEKDRLDSIKDIRSEVESNELDCEIDK